MQRSGQHAHDASGGPAATAPIALASASPRRRELLALLGVPFVQRPVDVDETPPVGVAPEAAVRAIALRKLSAATAKRQQDEPLILVADTIVVLDGRLLGKPADPGQARQILAALAGREHVVLTAVAAGPAGALEVVRTDVRMRPYSTAEIEESIAAGTPFDKAGGYAIQDPLLHPVEHCDGCYCSVVGLPLWTVYRMLRQALPWAGAVPPGRVLDRCAVCPLRESDAG